MSIVATHAMLRAWELGAASCWVNVFSNDKMRETLGLPEGERVVLIMPIGYADPSAKPHPKWHHACKPIDETVSYL